MIPTHRVFRARPAPVLGLLLFAGLACCAALARAQSYQDEMGYTSLANRLGASMPTGAGITATLVEASISGTNSYMPDAIAGKTFIDQTGSGVSSWHANDVADNLLGTGGAAPGISTINVYEADNWLQAGFLNEGQSAAPNPESANNPRVVNCSWAGNNDSDASNNDALRRLDYVIDRDNLFVAVAVDNGSGPLLKPLLANAYNAIAVGLSNGVSSYGPTLSGGGAGDGPGRSKPDIVAPSYETSFATPWVTGAAAALLQVAGQSPGYADANSHTEVIKAILMAGASKDAFTTWTRTPTAPLDPQFGTGQLNIDRSYQILTAGEQAPNGTTPVAATGWDWCSLSGGTTTRTYYFNVLPGQAQDFSAILTWNRQIALSTSTSPATLTPSLANLDLKLFQNSPNGTLVDSSVSTVDNVQQVFQRALPAGQYALQVTTSGSLSATWNYGLAWQLSAEPVWNGSGSSRNWTNDANWGGTMPVNPQTLIFGALSLFATSTISNNDFSYNAAASFNGIIFNAAAAGYTLQGNSVQLAGPVVNLSSSAQTINLPLTFVSGGGTLDTAAGPIAIAGVISGSGQGLIKTGSASLTLSAANAYTGGTLLNQGTLIVTNSASLGASGGSLSIGAATFEAAASFSSTGNISLNSPTSTVQVNPSATFSDSGTISGTGGLSKTGAGRLVLAGTGTLGSAANVNAGVLEVDGPLTLPAINLDSAAQLAGSGTISTTTHNGLLYQSSAVSTFSGSLSGAGVLDVAGGTLILSGSDTYTGGTVVKVATLILASGHALPDRSSPTVGAGGVLIFDPSRAADPITSSRPHRAMRCRNREPRPC